MKRRGFLKSIAIACVSAPLVVRAAMEKPKVVFTRELRCTVSAALNRHLDAPFADVVIMGTNGQRREKLYWDSDPVPVYRGETIMVVEGCAMANEATLEQ